MPHINVVYPFLVPQAFEAALPIVAAICARHPGFILTLARFAWFRHRQRRYTVWLAPEPAAPLQRLHADLVTAFPQCDDLDRFPHGYTPHLSIGQFSGPHDALLAFIAERQRRWRPLRFAVAHLSLIQRGDPPDDVFREIRRFPLQPADA